MFTYGERGRPLFGSNFPEILPPPEENRTPVETLWGVKRSRGSWKDFSRNWRTVLGITFGLELVFPSEKPDGNFEIRGVFIFK